MVLKVSREHRDLKVFRGIREPLVLRVYKELKDHRDSREFRVLKD